MRTTEEIKAETLRVATRIVELEDKISHTLVINADDVYDMRELVAEKDDLYGRLDALQWVQGIDGIDGCLTD